MRSQLQRLAQNTLIYGLGDATVRFINLLLLPLFTAYLTPDDYGINALLGLLNLVTTAIFSLGLGAAIGAFYFEGNSNQRKAATIWTAFVILLISTLILIVLGIAFASPLSIIAFKSDNYQQFIVLTLITVGFSILSIPCSLYLQLEQRAKSFVVITILSTIISISLDTLMVVVLKRGVRGLVEAGLLSQAMLLLLFVIPCVRRIRFRIEWRLAKKLILLGIPLVPSFAALFILQQGNKYLLEWMSGLTALGIYSVGLTFGTAISILVSAFQNSWLPYFMSFQDRKAEAEHLFGLVLTYYVFIGGSLSLVFFIIAKPIIMIMTHPAFYDAYRVVGLAATSYFLTGAFIIFLPPVYFAKDVKYISLMQGLAAIASILFNLVGISLFGYFGAALALMLGTLIMPVVQYFWNYWHRTTYVHIRYEWHRVFKFTVIYIIYAVCLLWERPYILISEIAISSIALILLPVLLYTLLKQQERTILLSILLNVCYKIKSSSSFRSA